MGDRPREFVDRSGVAPVCVFSWLILIPRDMRQSLGETDMGLPISGFSKAGAAVHVRGGST
jgi:hypothetical protein